MSKKKNPRLSIDGSTIGANSYVSKAEAETYFNGVESVNADDAISGQSLILATAIFDRHYALVSEKRYTQLDLVIMKNHHYRMLMACLKVGALSLIGIFYKTEYCIYWDELTGDLVIRYE